ncbi:MAG: T9SS type A sorting domain-containing protein [Candidatus Eisenbacteria bacterium]|nr:T9SS type A sorting domain-containing protein [Candidatus Latescibacterota bacterium]MBD3300978.1 T9SS type A sorting domain-containing protein [Candidatus Eisenbacteria bacterium]
MDRARIASSVRFRNLLNCNRIRSEYGMMVPIRTAEQAAQHEEEPMTVSIPIPLHRLLPYFVLWIALATPASAAGPRGTVLADFESGSVDLVSYDADQDQDPNQWELTDENTHDGSAYSLRIWGNSWKRQPIAPYPIDGETVFRVAAYIEEIGEMQAFGIANGTDVLLYTFAGTQLPTSEVWEVEYQGAFPVHEWQIYELPVGRDWFHRFGYYPDVTDLVYINDHDEVPEGITLFDDVIDVTEDLPVAPLAEILVGRQEVERIAASLFRVGVQFQAEVYDPDSDAFTFAWDFGDSTFSDEEAPFHEFLVEADHTYTVTLGARDELGLWGRDSAQVTVEPGEPEGPSTMNIAGDVMLARRYEQPGGVIYEEGVEAVFTPTKPIYGDAADVTICNLESPLTDEGEPHPTKSYIFRGSPENVAGLVFAEIDVVSLGNNHIIDFGQRGMEETQEVLDAAEIRWSGAGDNEYFANQATIWTENGVALGFLGQCNRTGREWNYQPFLDAAANKPGFSYHVEPNLTGAIGGIREVVDLVVLQVHSGSEYATDPGAAFGIPKQEPPYDAVGPSPQMMDFTFPTRPSLSDRELRWRAVDAGADLVICHHPHVLQGFEVYNGVLIAHSMGNFAFDQTFVETFPSMILSTEFDKTGFRSYTYRPVFIDEMVPQPASGRLGREILDRVADYSRELATVVTVNPYAMTGTIWTDPEAVPWQEAVEERTVAAEERDGAWITAPIPRDADGTLSGIVSIDPPGAEVRVGREILWHGDFEAEGATLWRLNSPDEEYDDTVYRQGRRSLRQHRDPQNHGPVTTDLEGSPPILGGTDFSVSGWIRTENAREVGITARFYEGRYGGFVEEFEAGELLDGTNDWTFVWNDATVLEEANYFNVVCHGERPQDGDAYQWFDEVRLVEWEPWAPAETPIDVPYPNNLRFLQVRVPDAADSVRIVWTEQVPEGLPVAAPEEAGDEPALAAGFTSVWPNPFRSEVGIAYRLPRAGQVRLEVFDLGGRRVALLEDRVRSAGRHQATWEPDGLAAGLYFCRLQVGEETTTRKVLHLK